MLIRGNAATSAAIHWGDSSDIPVVLIKSQLGQTQLIFATGGLQSVNNYMFRFLYWPSSYSL